MNARKLRYRSDTERAAVIERLRDTLAAWQREWALDAAALSHHAAHIEESAGGTALPPWYSLGSDAAGAMAAFYRVLPVEHAAGSLAAQECAIAQHWLGLPSPGVSPRGPERPLLGARLAQLAQDSMFRAVAGLVGCAAVQALPAGKAPNDCARPFSGALRIVTRGAGATLEWLFPADTVDRLSPPRVPSAPRARPALAPVAEALSQRKLTVGVEIDPVTLTLGELSGLHAGDVITLGHRLDAPLSVIDAAGNALFGGFLIARDGRKSLKLHADSNR